MSTRAGNSGAGTRYFESSTSSRMTIALALKDATSSASNKSRVKYDSFGSIFNRQHVAAGGALHRGRSHARGHCRPTYAVGNRAEGPLLAGSARTWASAFPRSRAGTERPARFADVVPCELACRRPWHASSLPPRVRGHGPCPAGRICARVMRRTRRRIRRTPQPRRLTAPAAPPRPSTSRTAAPRRS